MRRGALALLLPLGVLAATATVPAETGCTTHQCDTSCIVLGSTTASNPGCSNPISSAEWGDLVQDGNTLVWETAPLLGGSWLDFKGAATYLMYWPPEVTAFINSSCPAGSLTPPAGSPPCGFPGGPAPAAIIDIEPDLSIAQTQAGQGWNSTVNGAGQIAEWGGINPYVMEISNQTCAEYFLRVLVTVTIPVAPTADAGGD